MAKQMSSVRIQSIIVLVAQIMYPNKPNDVAPINFDSIEQELNKPSVTSNAHCGKCTLLITLFLSALRSFAENIIVLTSSR